MATASPSIDATALAALLEQISSTSEHYTAADHYPSPSSRSSTVEPPEDEDREYEIKCHQAILDGGGRPLFHFDLVPQIKANPDEYTNLVQPWVRQQHPADAKEPWLALSRQWNRWKEFCAWQLRGRRRRPAFEEYLDARRREFLMRGGIAKCAAQPDFERSARLSWEREYNYEDKEDVERHAGRVGRWLVHQGFVLRRPFRMLADPKGQDHWTTYIEYLAFEVESLYVLSEAARKLERRVKIRDSYEGEYRAAKTAVEQQRCRVDWVLSEIEKIEEEEKALGADESGDGNSGRIRKKRRIDKTSPAPENVMKPQIGKHRRMDKMEETEEMPAGKRDNLSQARQRKRRKSSADEEEEDEIDKDVLEPRSKRRKMVSTKDDPNSSSISQPHTFDSGAPAVSAVTTSNTAPSHQRRRSKCITTPRGTAAAAPPDYYRERLKSLRRRVNGKAVTGLTDFKRAQRGKEV